MCCVTAMMKPRIESQRWISRRTENFQPRRRCKSPSRFQMHKDTGSVTIGRQGMSIIIDKIGYRRRGEEASGTNNGEHIVERAITKLGSWLNWEVAGKKPSWNDILIKEPQWLEFQLKFVYDMLPTTTILATKGKRNDSNCILCYRQDNSRQMDDKHEDKHVTRFSPFLHTCLKRQGKDLRRTKESGGQNRVRGVEGGSMLHTISDWQIQANLNCRMQYPWK